MPATMPAKDPSDAPDDWLQAYVIYLSEDGEGDDSFADKIKAICRMHDIAKREGGRTWHVPYEEAKAELVRRGLREPDPEPEFFSRSETIAAIKEKLGCKLPEARFWAHPLPFKRDNSGRQWYRREDVRSFLAEL